MSQTRINSRNRSWPQRQTQATHARAALQCTSLWKQILLCLGLLTALTCYTWYSQQAHASSHIIYVKSDATGLEDGSNWFNAYIDLQDALTAAGPGDEIWVAAGTYLPDTGTDRTVSFTLKSDVAIYGGFAGNESSRTQRDFVANVTILSGDLEGDDILKSGPVPDTYSDLQNNNSYHVVYAEDVNAGAILDGFTIASGLADSNGLNESGGGILIFRSAVPTLRNLIIRSNAATEGGAGIYITQSSSPTLENVDVRNNGALTGVGGGLRVDDESTVTLLNSSLRGNFADQNGGGLFLSEAHAQLVNTVISGNQANSAGGGVDVQNSSALTATNVTISGNVVTSGSAGGGLHLNDSSAVLQNSIVWNNAIHSNVDTTAASIARVSGATATVSHSLLAGCNPAGVWNTACGTDDGNNLADGNPQFRAAIALDVEPTAEGDLVPSYTSPVLNVGNNAADLDGVPGGDTIAQVATDRAGNVRINHTTVDLGAYEAPDLICSNGQRFYVDQSAAPGGDGSSWATAFNELSSPLLHVAPSTSNVTCIFWVAQGVYLPTPNFPNPAFDPRILIQNKSVAIYGGFTGTETQLSERDWTANPTILSGDVDQNDITTGGVVMDPADIVGDNLAVILELDNAVVTLDGFSVTGASAPTGGSAGIIVREGTTTLRNLLLRGNQPRAVRNMPPLGGPSGTISIIDSEIRNNGGAFDGGGGYFIRMDVMLDNVNVRDNTTTGTGGGLYITNGNATVSHVMFSDNTANAGGGLYFDAEDLRRIELSHVSAHNNTATGATNEIGDGGGLYLDGSFSTFYTPALSSAEYLTVTNNTAQRYGGGIHHARIPLQAQHVTLTDNTAEGGGGIYSRDTLTLTHASILNNLAGGPGGGIALTGSSDATHGYFGYVEIRGNRATTDIDLGEIYENLEGQIEGEIDFEPVYPTPGGGGIYVAGTALTVHNSLISGNRTEGPTTGGGGIGSFSTSLELINVTITGNRAAANGGGYLSLLETSPLIRNSVIWDNQADAPANDASHNIFPDNANPYWDFVLGLQSLAYPQSNPEIEHSLAGFCKPGGVWQTICGSDGGGNLTDADPLFTDPIDPADAATSAGDFTQLGGSPLIESGNSAYLTGDMLTDLAGAPRIIGAAVDVGAYEVDAFAISTAIVGGGTVARTPDQPAYSLGTEVTLAATANAGREFTGWSGDLVGTATPQTLTVNAIRTVTATFANLLPTAQAGPDQNVLVGELVTLDGSASSDPDPTQTLTYSWTQTSGAAVTLIDPTAGQPTFTPTAPGSYTFQLIVTDNFGGSSTPDSVTIQADEIAITGLTATNDGPTTVGQSTPFNAQVSGGSNVAYSWDFGDGNTGTGANPTHVYATVNTYTATVTATNALGNFTAETVVSVENVPPIALPGPDQTVAPETLVTLDGSLSSDPDNHLPLTFAWTQLAGTGVFINGASMAQPTFISPSQPTTLTLQLIVTDDFGASSEPAILTVFIVDPSDGGNPDGGNPDGGDPDGGDPDGGDPDGGDPNGGDPDGGDPDGDDPDGGDPDGGDPDNGDPDGGDPDGGDPDGDDPDGSDPDGGDPDNGDPDGGDPDGVNNRLFVPGLERG